MNLERQTIIINADNVKRLINLYGDIKDAGELSDIVNKHLTAAIDEIEEDCLRQIRMSKGYDKSTADLK